MLYRTFTETLETWYRQKKKLALLIDGARQIGKTTIVREFALRHYQDNFLEINFLTTPSAKEIFSQDLSAEEIITKLTLFARKKLIPHRTLIFFDEVQECLQVRTAIKFLVEDARFDYIESGSLLGLSYKGITSYAVGFEQIKTMHPMTFFEFALANGIQESTLASLRKSYLEKSPVDAFIHSQMLKLFAYYTIIGGMPAVVQEYVQSKDMMDVIELQRAILALYQKDITQYAEDKIKVKDIFDAIPSELNAKNKRFMLSDLSKTARHERYFSSFNWLVDAGVALPCYNLEDIKEPVAINKKRNLFKLFMNDSGLLCSMCSTDIQFQIVNDNLDINEGSIAENVIATQLKANGFDLYYFDKNKLGEVDFIIEQQSNLIPVEIKSGNTYKRHQALDALLQIKGYNLQESHVYCKGNIEQEGNITYFPLYMIMFLKKENFLGSIDSFELKI